MTDDKLNRILHKRVGMIGYWLFVNRYLLLPDSVYVSFSQTLDPRPHTR